MSDSPSPSSTNAAVRPASGGLAIHVRNAAVWHDGQPVFQHVDADVRRGEFVAILGPNGTGKSTFVKALLGLTSMTADEVTVLGGPPGSANRRIGYVPQRRHFDASVRLRGVDVVRLGLDGERWGLPLPGFLDGEACLVWQASHNARPNPDPSILSSLLSASVFRSIL